MAMTPESKRDLPDRTFEFAKRIVKLCKVLEDAGGISRTLGKQLLRSGTSVGANVEEGQASHSRADFIAKYGIACKEARETHYWLRLMAATDILPKDKLESITQEAHELIAILTTIIKKTRAGNTTTKPQPKNLDQT